MDQIISCCGVVCSECEHYPADCKGCAAIRGNVFWLEYTGESICDIYECCVDIQKLSHCGKCIKFPCDKYDRTDPTKTQEENEDDFKKQVAQLRSMDSDLFII